MFGWFRPTCPCDPEAKRWVEQRLKWLTGQFGLHILLERPIILPTPEFFPDRYEGPDGVRVLLDHVCEYMGVDPDRVMLKFVSDAGKIWLVNDAGHYLPHAAGTFQERFGRFVIRIDRSGLDDPMGLVGTMAHELAHARLIGDGRIDPEVYDNELLTDLTVVYFGLGVFLANTPRNWDSQYTRWPNSDLKKPEYMTPPMFGWALAHLAWFRDEEKPVWAKYLHLNARPSFRQGLRYLQQTADSRFQPVRLRTPGADETE